MNQPLFCLKRFLFSSLIIIVSLLGSSKAYANGSSAFQCEGSSARTNNQVTAVQFEGNQIQAVRGENGNVWYRIGLGNFVEIQNTATNAAPRLVLYGENVLLFWIGTDGHIWYLEMVTIPGLMPFNDLGITRAPMEPQATRSASLNLNIQPLVLAPEGGAVYVFANFTDQVPRYAAFTPLVTQTTTPAWNTFPNFNITNAPLGGAVFHNTPNTMLVIYTGTDNNLYGVRVTAGGGAQGAPIGLDIGGFQTTTGVALAANEFSSFAHFLLVVTGMDGQVFTSTMDGFNINAAQTLRQLPTLPSGTLTNLPPNVYATPQNNTPTSIDVAVELPTRTGCQLYSVGGNSN